MECTCVEMTDLHFIVGTDSLSTPLIEREEPSRKHEESGQTLRGGGQCMNKRHSMLIGNLFLVPIPVHIDAEA